MGRFLYVVVGVLLVLVGVIWTLQGLGYVTGSETTGERAWVFVGAAVALLGVLTFWRGLRRIRS